MSQSDIPSQAEPIGPPYYPAARPFNIPPPNTVPGAPPTNAFVVSTFDARQIGGFDFHVTPQVSLEDVGEGAPTLATCSFVIPFGYVGIVRAIGVTASVSNNLVNNASATNIFGVPNRLGLGLFLSAYVNGSGVEGFTDIPAPDVICGVSHFPCYIIAEAEQTIRIDLRATAQTFSFGSDGVIMYAYGNLITQTGRPLLSEPAGREPVPVNVVQPGPLA